MANSERYIDSEGRTHLAREGMFKTLAQVPVEVCGKCEGLIANWGAKPKNVFGYPDTGFYFKKGSVHQCHVRLSRGHVATTKGNKE